MKVCYIRNCTYHIIFLVLGTLFALARYIPEQHVVEPVIDSSRYFVLRIETQQQDQGPTRHAFIGIGFAERHDAFDFSTTLADYKRHQDVDSSMSLKSSRDFKLKEDQCFSIGSTNLPSTSSFYTKETFLSIFLIS
jgi:hypothetical protein